MNNNLKSVAITSALILFISLVIVSNSVSPSYYKAAVVDSVAKTAIKSPLISSTEAPTCPDQSQTCYPGTSEEHNDKSDPKKITACCGGEVCGSPGSQTCLATGMPCK